MPPTTRSDTEGGIADPPGAAEFLGIADGGKVCYPGTHRVRTLDSTVDLAWRARAQAGVSRVADITGLDTVGIPVFNTMRPLAAPGNLTVTCGKGVDRAAALASALMEAIERHSGEQHDRRGVIGALHQVAATRKVLHPNALIPDRHSPWTEDDAIEWWPFRAIRDDDVVLLPAAAAFTPYRAVHPRLTGSVSDGLASGNSRPEAALHALYELIERDASAFGEVARRGHRVPLTSIPAAHSELVERFHRNGIAVRIFSFSGGIGIPVFHVTIDDRDCGDALFINSGAGCHLSPEIALYRALTEAAQSRLSAISGGREDIARHLTRRGDGYAVARERADRWADGWPERRFGDHADLCTGTLAGDMDVVRRRLSHAALDDIYMSDLTMPGIPFAVVRVVVPGLEFFHQEPGRLGQRLYAELTRRAR